MSKTEQSAKNPFSAADGQGAQATIAALEPKCLSLLTSIYITALVLTMSMASKFIAIGPFNICGATLVFPITYIFNDIFTEVYGYQRSRRIIWMGLGAQAFTGFAYWILGLWPPAPFWHNQEAYMTILGTGPRVAAASLLAYVFGEFTNSIVISKLKFKQGGKGGIKQGWRFLASTIVGEAVDTSIFFPVAFVGIIAWPELSQTMITVYLVKVLYEFVALPVSISIANAIKRQERIDVIDKPEETDYSLARF
ncbi:MAG: queuosine precursor transporter [Candidatus Obscuribacterales bacterium]|nr:queuosine precursor transporter [Candidatus Obscuribacterales bacterium]